MVDLDQLSREVAAASSAWAIPGVRCLDPTTGIAFRVNADFTLCPDSEAHSNAWGMWRDRLTEAEAYPDGFDGRSSAANRALAAGPDLRDPVTVNALLGNGQAWRRIIGGGVAWVASVDLVHERTEDDRTAAICRAWIAARGKR
jgi:hypothetical protein